MLLCTDSLFNRHTSIVSSIEPSTCTCIMPPIITAVKKLLLTFVGLNIGGGTYGSGRAMALPLKILVRSGPTNNNNNEGPTSSSYYPDFKLNSSPILD